MRGARRSTAYQLAVIGQEEKNTHLDSEQRKRPRGGKLFGDVQLALEGDGAALGAGSEPDDGPDIRFDLVRTVLEPLFAPDLGIEIDDAPAEAHGHDRLNVDDARRGGVQVDLARDDGASRVGCLDVPSQSLAHVLFKVRTGLARKTVPLIITSSIPLSFPGHCIGAVMSHPLGSAAGPGMGCPFEYA